MAQAVQRDNKIHSQVAIARDAIIAKDSNTLKASLNIHNSNDLGKIAMNRVFGRVLGDLKGTWAVIGARSALDAGVDVNATDTDVRKDGRALLHHAAAAGNEPLVNLLITAYRDQLDVNHASHAGRTALHEAAYNASQGSLAHLNIIELLLDNGAQLEFADLQGATALILAVENVRTDAALLLVKRGASVGATRRDGKSVLQILSGGRYQQGGPALYTEIQMVRNSQSIQKSLDGPKEVWVRECKSIRGSIINLEAHVNFATQPRGLTLAVGPAHTSNVERLRIGDWDVLSDTYFDRDESTGKCGTGAVDPDLYTALAYTTAGVDPCVCSPDDVKERLDVYESLLAGELHQLSKVRVNPLYFVAHARLAKLLSQTHRRLLMLLHFKRHFGDLARCVGNGGWLTQDEIEVIERAVTIKNRTEPGRVTSSLSPSLLPSITDPYPGECAPDSIEALWASFREKLTKEQREPMEGVHTGDKESDYDGLLELTGLSAVKTIAVEIYRGVLADQKLICSGYPESVGERFLNFCFLGNPGTGKSTVGKLFAKLLAAAGARPGHKYIEMKASQAMRMGAKKFAAELSSITGGAKAVAPPPTEIRRGMAVEVNLSSSQPPRLIPTAPTATAGTSARADIASVDWYPATVLLVNDDNTVDVEYSNGEVDEKVNPDGFKKVRPMGHGNQVGGVLFLDEAYDLEPASNRVGAEIFNEIMAAAEDHRDKVTIILAGYREDVERKLYAYNVGLRRRFIDVPFVDFDYDQLHEIFCARLMRSGWVTDPGVARVAARRVARGIGSKSFGNAGEVRKIFAKSIERAKQDFFDGGPGIARVMHVEHVIGKRPSTHTVPELRKALHELGGMIGLASVKNEVDELVALAQNNYDKELRGEAIDAIPLNRLFLGNPGTGKTTVALLYGRILAALGLISKGDVMDRKATDFKGAVVGESERQTNTILELAQGNVLLIDEAYVLNDGRNGQGSYGRAVLDTIVEKVHGRPGEDIAVILAGYEPQMLKMLRDQNPGLARRFNPDSALWFEDFSDAELLRILSAECVKTHTRASFSVKRVAVKHLSRRRALPNFGNAGAVKSMLADAKRRMVSRCKKAGVASKDYMLNSVDFVGGPGDVDADPMLLLRELEDVGNFKVKLEQLGKYVQLFRSEGAPTEDLLTNYIFTGETGTGKTTVARKMGAILHAYGMLARPDVIVTTGEGMTGEFVGQTKKNVEEKMQAARGGVLFVDEAYDLGKGKFGQEAMNTLLAMLTEPEFKGKTVVVLAGYKEDMHEMLSRNPGMKSRFQPSGYVDFPNWTALKCLDVVRRRASSAVPTAYVLTESAEGILRDGFEMLKQRPGWANARDAESMFQLLTTSRCDRLVEASENSVEDPRQITDADAGTAVAAFIRTRPPVVADIAREDGVQPSAFVDDLPMQIDEAAPIPVQVHAQVRSKSVEREPAVSQSLQNDDAAYCEDNNNEETAVFEEEEVVALEQDEEVALEDADSEALPVDDEDTLHDRFTGLFEGIAEIEVPGSGKKIDVLNHRHSGGGGLGDDSLESLLEKKARNKGMSKGDYVTKIISDPNGNRGEALKPLIQNLVAAMLNRKLISQRGISMAKREVLRAVKRWIEAQKEALRLRKLLEAKLRKMLRRKKAVFKCNFCGRPWGNGPGQCTYMGPVFSHYEIEEASDAEIDAACQKY